MSASGMKVKSIGTEQEWEIQVDTPSNVKVFGPVDQLAFPIKPEWGSDLRAEHEKYLCETVFTTITIVTDFPKDIKAKYMYLNDNGKIVAGVGEIFGGSQRETRLERFAPEMNKFGPNGEYELYLDLRRFGNVPHSGFGMGFERFVCWLTGVSSVKDVAEFPVAYQHLKA